jgi:hypothetical protein
MKRIVFFTIASVMAAAASAGAIDIAADQQYLLLATSKTSTMEKELSEAANQGFRVVACSTTSGTEMVSFLERVATPPDIYRYKLLATSRTGTMQKELNEAAEQGFRLVPKSIIAKQQLMGGTEIVALLECPPQETKRYEYKLLATVRTSTLQKEAREAKAAGFNIVGMVSRDEHMVILERESDLK